MCIPFDKNVMEGGQPHLAIVLLWYPLFTQPFIFREVENLSRIMPVEVYTLYGLNLRKCSVEMHKASNRAHVYGAVSVAGVCSQFIKSFFRNPRFILKLLKRSLFHKWPGLEIFGENLWAFIVGISLGERFREDGIDFVYAPWPRGAATAAWVAASIADIPLALSARGDNLNPPDPDLLIKLKAALVIRANNMADKIRIDAMLGNTEKTVLIYNSLTLPKPAGVHPQSDNEKIRLLALGRFDVTKGFDVLLKACALLKEKGIPFELTLAGGGGKVMGLGDMGTKLADLRKNLRLENEVVMPGLISHDKLPDILNEHDIFIAPCIVHESGKMDGIPNTVIEALAYGMPVISTNVNALPEVVKNNDTGLTVEAGDAGQLADAIIKLGNDPGLRARLGKAGAQLAFSMFDTQRNVRAMANMFNDFYHKTGRK